MVRAGGGRPALLCTPARLEVAAWPFQDSAQTEKPLIGQKLPTGVKVP